MGTPDFAVESLRQILEANIDVVGVITAPDRPAGRGQQLRESAVKVFAKENQLNILQPENLKDESFINELRSLQADLFVVVAFRMLPEVVWNMPSKGTINLHGSLLPQYRGAAPINWAVMNGEKETGATTFFIEKKIDTGKVIDQVKIAIGENDSAGKIHDELMVKGAALLTQTVKAILSDEVKAIPQSNLIEEELKSAPKIFKQNCKVDWTNDTASIHNMIRGLSPYPTAWTEVHLNGATKSLKIFNTLKAIDGQNHTFQIKLNEEKLYFGTSDGWLEILDLQLEGKKRMQASDFIKGFSITDCTLQN